MNSFFKHFVRFSIFFIVYICYTQYIRTFSDTYMLCVEPNPTSSLLCLPISPRYQVAISTPYVHVEFYVSIQKSRTFLQLVGVSSDSASKNGKAHFSQRTES